jgi:hypothetical protein
MGLKQKITKTVASVSENLITGDDILSVLKRDHRKVTELFAEIEDTENTDVQLRTDLFTRLKTDLTIHSETEERLFYSPLRQKAETSDLINHSFEEHNEIRHYLNLVSSLNPVNPEWMVNLKNLKNTVNHHVKEEEGKLFGKAKKVFTEEQLLDIGMKFTQEKMSALNKGKSIH